MRKKKRIIGLLGVGLLAMSLSGCMLSEFKSLPHEERYQYIDNVLETIDYKTVGEISKETIDHNDGIFGPSYKEIHYKNKNSYDELGKRLKEANPDCIVTGDQFHCNFPFVSVSVYSQNPQYGDTRISVTDTAGGRGGRNND